MRAPAIWSTDRACSGSRPVDCRLTYGTSIESWARVSNTRTCGAMTTRPSMPWAARWASPSAIDRASDRLDVRRAHPVARRPGGLLDRRDARGGAVLRARCREDADRAGPARHQRPRGAIRLVLQPLHDVEHALLRLGPDARMVVQHPGHGLVRDARQPRDIADAGGLGPLEFLWHVVLDRALGMCTVTFAGTPLCTLPRGNVTVTDVTVTGLSEPRMWPRAA